jgi:hypothetical protein
MLLWGAKYLNMKLRRMLNGESLTEIIYWIIEIDC